MRIFELRPENRNVSNEELIADLVRVAGELGAKCVTMKQYNAHGKFKYKRYCVRFGSWLNALDAAGLEKTRHYRVTDAELFENMRKVWTILGRQPIFREMKKPLSKFRGRVYLYTFGTWRK